MVACGLIWYQCIATTVPYSEISKISTNIPTITNIYDAISENQEICANRHFGYQHDQYTDHIHVDYTLHSEPKEIRHDSMGYTLKRALK